MSTTVKQLLVALGICLLASSCGPKQASNVKPTVPVKGEVYVDGKPAADVAITCENVQGQDAKNPTVSSAKTKEDGKFAISTYEKGDGVPEGEYGLAFTWREYSAFKHAYVGPEKLGKRYSDPKQSKVRFKVEKGKPVDLGKIELTTK
jgi:5-hydroxyisourate hydrolase-like protein (transthyretin family)